jgi:hypothetical protein
MFGSAAVYSGLIVALAALVLLVKPMPRIGVGTRRRAVSVIALGTAMTTAGLVAPAFESRVTHATTALDEFMPVWQFHEVHSVRIAAPPARVFAAIRQVRADEILLFRTLTWIRRGGRPEPPGILNPGANEPLLDVATRTSFARLADIAPRELVIGTVIVAPPGTHGRLTPAVFKTSLPPGFILAAMDFRVYPNGSVGSIVSTETRVYANSPAARRLFAAYWRLIYPGSALIRRMWLRAIARRADAIS